MKKTPIENSDSKEYTVCVGGVTGSASFASQLEYVMKESQRLWKIIYARDKEQAENEEENPLHRAVTELKSRLTDLEVRFYFTENSTQDGHLVWKIDEFENRSYNAAAGHFRDLYSAPCYTEKYGYKFCLRLYLHGDGVGRETHLSLFLVIMKSEYDDILQWPFQKKIKFKLINQQDRSKDHTEQMFPEKNSSSFQQPKKDMNIASGCPLFISLDRLKPEGFLKNGNLFVEIKIE